MTPSPNPPPPQSVSFQQSLIRDGNFRNAKLVSASFFDADLTGARLRVFFWGLWVGLSWVVLWRGGPFVPSL